MQKPDDIPQDIWEAANVKCDLKAESALRIAIARAILAERDRLTSPEFLEEMLSAAMKEAGVKIVDDPYANLTVGPREFAARYVPLIDGMSDEEFARDRSNENPNVAAAKPQART